MTKPDATPRVTVEDAKRSLLRAIVANGNGEYLLQLAQAYEALCTGEAMGGASGDAEVDTEPPVTEFRTSQDGLRMGWMSGPNPPVHTLVGATVKAASVQPIDPHKPYPVVLSIEFTDGSGLVATTGYPIRMVFPR